MLSYEQCKHILNQKENKYTDEQVKEVRALLYHLAQIEYLNFKEQSHVQEGHTVYQSIHG